MTEEGRHNKSCRRPAQTCDISIVFGDGHLSGASGAAAVGQLTTNDVQLCQHVIFVETHRQTDRQTDRGGERERKIESLM